MRVVGTPTQGGALSSAASWRGRLAGLGVLVVVAAMLAACSSTNSSTTATTSATGHSSSSKIPQSAMSNHTGVTSSTVHVANIATLTPGGLFKGADVGAQAYFDYVNSKGGVDGRKIVIDSGDDQNQGAVNRQLTQSAINNDLAIVGEFSLQDSFGGQLLAQNPGMPDVSNVLDLTTSKLPNVFSAVPLGGGWEEGAIQYFHKRFPQDITAGAMIGDEPSSEAAWVGEKYVLQKVGFKVVYDPVFPITQTDFTQNVIAMRNAGVKIVFLEQMPENYAGSFLTDLAQQNYHPQIVFGAAAYSNQLVKSAGGPANIDGALLEQNASLYLGQDSSSIPAVSSFLHWVNVASPGFPADLFTLYGWVNAELFTQALDNAGSDPSRGSLLEALSKITSFNGGHIVTTSDPAAKTTSNCYLIGQIANGNFQRLDDTPINGPTNGYRCNYQYVTPPS
jgi:branched-chain amino acid transport system substrate-binding protein